MVQEKIEHISAQHMIDQVLDVGSFESWDEPADYSFADDAYRAQLEEAARRSGADEAVLTGSGTINGRKVAVVLS
ncbi:MAG: acetyl-CoA carboxyl transferase, partial [Glutamicibacter sp.]